MCQARALVPTVPARLAAWARSRSQGARGATRQVFLFIVTTAGARVAILVVLLHCLYLDAFVLLSPRRCDADAGAGMMSARTCRTSVGLRTIVACMMAEAPLSRLLSLQGSKRIVSCESGDWSAHRAILVILIRVGSLLTRVSQKRDCGCC